VVKHLVPHIGKHRLDRLEAEHLERLYQLLIASGAKPATAQQVHRTIRTALGEALRRGHVTRNVAAVAKPPRVQVESVRPYSVEEVRAILAAAQEVPNSARWAIALALGLRQGEVLGLRWSYIDLDRGLRPSGQRASALPIGTGVPGIAAASPVGVPSRSSSSDVPERPSRMPAAE
jgi:integrase